MEIQNIWNHSGYASPKLPYAVRNNQRFIVLDDTGTVFRLMDRNGIVYAVSSVRCAPVPDQNKYECQEPVLPINIRNITVKEQFAVDNILSTLDSS